jgi:hypothetical protein
MSLSLIACAETLNTKSKSPIFVSVFYEVEEEELACRSFGVTVSTKDTYCFNCHKLLVSD